MSKNKTSTRLVSMLLAVIMMLSMLPTTVFAATITPPVETEKPIVKMGNFTVVYPYESNGGNKVFQFSDVEVVLPNKGPMKDQPVSTIMISIENGKVWGDAPGASELPGGNWKVINDLTFSTYAYYYAGDTNGNVSSVDQVANIIKSFKFITTDPLKKPVVNVVLDCGGNNLKDITNLHSLTYFDNHFYAYVKYNAGGITWLDSYNAAKKGRFMGMQGYLATLSSEAESQALTKISPNGAWSGGTRLLTKGTNKEISDSASISTSESSWNITGANYWYWACGPDAGTQFYSRKAYDGKDDKVYNADGKSFPGTSVWQREYVTGEGWVNEPNNSTSKETCLQVNFKRTSNSQPKWNDLTWNRTPNAGETFVPQGYFMEFGGYSSDLEYAGTSSQEIPIYATEYDLAGGKLALNSETTSFEITADGNYSRIVHWADVVGEMRESGSTTALKPTREDYAFLGWSYAGVDVAADATYQGLANDNRNTTSLKLTARWVAEHNVTFKSGANGKLNTDQTEVKYKVQPGQAVGRNNVPTVVANMGYEFVGWKDSLNNLLLSTEAVGVLPIMQPITFTAEYKKIVADVVLLANGGQFSDANPDPNEVTVPGVGVGDLFTPSGKEIPTKENMRLIGWRKALNQITPTPGEGIPNESATRSFVVKPNQDDEGVYFDKVYYYAEWEDKPYTLTYNLNGGNSTVPTDSGKYDVGDKKTLNGVKPTHAKVSYNGREVNVLFAGWSQQSNPPGILKAGDTKPNTVTEVTFQLNNITVHAIWSYDLDGNGQPDVDETADKEVKYDVNGGSGVVVDYKKYIAGDTAVVSTVEPTYGTLADGAAVMFLGWTDSAQVILTANDEDKIASLELLDPGDSFVMPAGGKRLYAVWGKDTDKDGTADVYESKYKLGYAANGGSNTPTDDNKYVEGSSATLSTQQLVHAAVNGADVVFIGWTRAIFTTIVEGGATGVPDTVKTVKFETSDITAYALWGYDRNKNGVADYLEGAKFTLAYHANGGAGAPTDSSTYGSGQGVTLNTTVKPTHANANDGNGDSKKVVFIGWVAAQSIANKIFTANDAAPQTISSVVFNNANLAVYAAWGFASDGGDVADVEKPASEKYRVMYEVNGGKGGGQFIDSTYYAKGQSVKITEAKPIHDPVMYCGKMTNVVFLGWSTDWVQDVLKAGDTKPDASKIFQPKDVLTFGNTHINLYALWGYSTDGTTGDVDRPAADKFTLTYNANGGAGAPTDAGKYVQSNVVELVTSPKPTHVNAMLNGTSTPVAFVGWTTDVKAVGKIYMGDGRAIDAAGKETVGIVPAVIVDATFADKNITVYAIWGFSTSGTPDKPDLEIDPNAKYQLTYDGNGGTFGNVSINAITFVNPILFASGKTATLLTEAEIKDARFGLTHPDVEGKKVLFLGWSDQKIVKPLTASDREPAYLSSFTFGTKNMTVYAVWGVSTDGIKPDVKPDVNKFRAYYDANGGTGAPIDPNNYVKGSVLTVRQGEAPKHAAVTVVVGGTETTVGVSFVGWSITPMAILRGGDDMPELKETHIFDSSHLEVYAVWGYDFDNDGNPDVGKPAGQKHALTYKNPVWDGIGTISGILPGVKNYLEGERVDLLRPELKMDKAVFVGWSETQPAGLCKYSYEVDALNLAETLTFGTEAITVYSVWAVDQNGNGKPDYMESQYNIYYIANGAASGTTPDDSEHIRGEEITIPGNSGNLTKVGYHFVGWNTEPNGTGVSYGPLMSKLEPEDSQPQHQKVTIQGNLTLYAQWANNYYNVAFMDDPDVVGTAMLLGKDRVVHGATATAPVLDANRHKGWVQIGWDTDFTNVHSHLTVQAKYLKKAENQFTVNFVDWDGTLLKSEVVLKGNNATPPANPQREGYIFAAWDKSYKNIQSDMTITAQYMEDGPSVGDIYNVIFIGRNNAIIGNVQKVANGGYAVVPTPPKSTGYVFSGEWYRDSAYTTKADPTQKITSDMEFYAKYNKEVYTVSIVYPALPDGAMKTLTVNVAYGESVKPSDLPSDIKVPDGMILAGWTNTEFVTGETTVTPIFVEEPVPGVSSLVRYFGFKGNQIDAEVVKNGSKPVKNISVPSIAGYSWDGKWYDSSAYTNAVVPKDTVITDATDFYAQYTAKVYTVQFKDIDGKNLGDAIQVPHGQAVPRDEIPAAPEVPGKTFVGWNADLKEVTSNLIVMPVYKDNAKTNVIFHGLDRIVGVQLVPLGAPATAIAIPDEVGYTSDGKWYTDETFATEADFTAAIIGETHFYAKYARNTYTVTFEYPGKPDGAIVTKKVTVNHGENVSTAYLPSEDDVLIPEGQILVGWTGINNVTGNTVSKPVFAVTPEDGKSYLVKYFGKDLNLLGAETVLKDAKPTKVPNPNNMTGYTFEGWYLNQNFEGAVVDPAAQIITQTTSFYAKYAGEKLTVTFQDINGNVLKTVAVEYGKGVPAEEIPDAPQVAGKTFVNWDKNLEYITSNITTKPIYRDNDPSQGEFFTVVFVDFDYVLLDIQNVPKGGAAKAPADPIRKGYKFAGWDKDFINVQAPLTVVATYTLNDYTVTFKGIDGVTTLKEEKVPYGGSATAPSAPEVADMKFVGWDKSFQKVEEDITVTALYVKKDPSLKLFNVVFYGANATNESSGNSVIDAQVVAEGELAVVPTNMPVLEGYTFSGKWYKDAALTQEADVTEPIVANTNFYAGYVKKIYVVEFTYPARPSGALVTERIEVAHGENVPADKLPGTDKVLVPNGQILVGWTNTNHITSNVTSVPVFVEDQVDGKSFIVYYYGKDNVLIHAETVQKGENPAQVPTANEMPAVVGHAWNGKWFSSPGYTAEVNPGDESIIATTRFYAQYEAEYFEVQFKDENGDNLGEAIQVPYGSAVPADQVPEAPVKPGYTFVGWSEDIRYITQAISPRPIYVETQKVVVTFYGLNNRVLGAQLVMLGEQAEEPTVPQEFGYTWDGKWYLTDTYEQEADLALPIQGGAKFYAKYEQAIHEVTIVYPGVPDGDEVSETVEIPHGEDVPDSKLPAADKVLIPEGQQLVGWTNIKNVTEAVTVTPVFADIPVYDKSYLVKYFGKDSNLISAEVVDKDTVPTKIPTEDEMPVVTGYAWNNKWYTSDKYTQEVDVSTQTITAHTSYYAQYTAESYTVQFRDADGKELGEVIDVLYGAAVPKDKIPTAPVKVGYTFVAWSENLECVTTNIEPTPIYVEKVENATVTFYGVNDHIIDRKIVKIGTTVVAPTQFPVVSGGRYTGKWYTDKGLTKEANLSAAIKVDTAFYAGFEPASYTVTIEYPSKALGGQTKIMTVQVSHGEQLTADKLPTADVQVPEGFTMVGWSNAGAVLGNTTMKPIFVETPIPGEAFLVKYIGKYGNLLGAEAVAKEGKPANVPEPPAVLGSEWDGKWYTSDSYTESVNLMTVKIVEDTSFYAGYTEQTYKVQFKDENGNNLGEAVMVPHGGAVPKDKIPTAPKKEGYTFVGWDQDITSVTQNLSPKAVYVKDDNGVIKKFNVVFLDWDGTVIDRQTVSEGEDAVLPTAPERDGYLFDQWSASHKNIKEETIIVALYTEVEIGYRVVFLGVTDNQLGDVQFVRAGQSAIPPVAPTVEGYKFIGWDKDYSNVQSDMTIKAVYTRNIPEGENKANVSFVDWNNVVFATFVVDTPADITGDSRIPEDPTREGYDFVQWSNKELMENITEDTIFKAVYASQKVIVRFLLDENTTFVTQNDPMAIQILLSGNRINGVPKVTANSGYTFMGWKLVGGDGSIMTEAAIRNIAVYRNLEIKAFTLKNSTDGGTTGGGTSTGSNKPYPNTSAPFGHGNLWLNTEDHFAYIFGVDGVGVAPNNNITRAEVAMILYRVLTDESKKIYETNVSTFTDVHQSDWYNTAAATIANAGIIKGLPNGDFGGSQLITRAELATILVRISGQTEYTGKTMFGDITDHWAAKEINIAGSNGWVRGMPDMNFDPNRNITRSEAITMINRVLGRDLVRSEGMLTDMKTWSDCPQTAWYYEAVQEATNGHDFVRDGAGYEKWTKLH